MWSWWNSIEMVCKFNTYMQISIVVFGFLTASATLLSSIAANRISEIQAKKEIDTHKRLEAAESANKLLENQLEHLKTAPVDTKRLRGAIDGGNAKGE